MYTAQNGNTAYKYYEPDYYNLDVHKKTSIRKDNVNKTRVRPVNKAKTVSCVLICFVIALSIVFRYGEITRLNNNVNKAKRQLSQLQKSNEQMGIRIDGSIDLKKIEMLAINELGMKRPEKYQITYIKLKNNDYGEVIKETLVKKSIKEKITNISNIINNVLAYLY